MWPLFVACPASHIRRTRQNVSETLCRRQFFLGLKGFMGTQGCFSSLWDPCVGVCRHTVVIERDPPKMRSPLAKRIINHVFISSVIYRPP